MQSNFHLLFGLPVSLIVTVLEKRKKKVILPETSIALQEGFKLEGGKKIRFGTK